MVSSGVAAVLVVAASAPLPMSAPRIRLTNPGFSLLGFGASFLAVGLGTGVAGVIRFTAGSSLFTSFCLACSEVSLSVSTSI